MSTPSYSPSESPFLERVRRTLRLKHMSRRTEKSYLYYILDYIYFHNKQHPQDMGVEEIRTYLSYLATDRKIAASTQNIALSALLFLYRQVLRVDLPNIENIERARQTRHLPVVLPCWSGSGTSTARSSASIPTPRPLASALHIDLL